MKVSVLIPAFNAEPYLGAAIESALDQTSPAHEIIVVDDGSTDATTAVARRFGGRVAVLQQAQQGPSAARNHGAAFASGDWIAFLDADDTFFPEKLEKQLALIEAKPDTVLVYSGLRKVYADGTSEDRAAFPPSKLGQALRYRNPILPSSTMLKTEALARVGPFDPAIRGLEDWDLWLRIARAFTVARIDAIPEPLVTYNVLPGSVSSDPMRMLGVRLAILDRLLFGLHGYERLAWRQQILSFFDFDAAVALREGNHPGDFWLCWRSLARWPFWGAVLPKRRYKVFASMLLSALGHRSAR